MNGDASSDDGWLIQGPVSHDKATRLVRLLVLLLRGPTSREAIRTALAPFYGESPDKALQRDLRDLQDALPRPARLVFSNRRQLVALEDFPLQIVRTTEERQALAQISEVFSVDLPQAEAVRALVARLLGDAGKCDGRVSVHMRLTLATSYAAHAGTIRALEKTIRDGVDVAFAYHASGRQERQHAHIEPGRLILHGDHLYLEGYCHERQAPLDFRVDRIVAGSVQMLPAYHGEPRARRLVAVRFRLFPPLADGEISLRLSDQRIVERADDGSVVVEGKARSLFEAARLLLGYGPLAEALAPVELRERVAREVRAMARIYDEQAASTDSITPPANPSSVT